MKNELDKTAEWVAGEKLRLAALNLQHLMKINDEQVSLEAIVDSLQQTLHDAQAGATYDFSDILASQARILDGVFTYYMSKANKAYTEDDKINMALKAQRQTKNTITAWKQLRKPDKK